MLLLFAHLGLNSESYRFNQATVSWSISDKLVCVGRMFMLLISWWCWPTSTSAASKQFGTFYFISLLWPTKNRWTVILHRDHASFQFRLDPIAKSKRVTEVRGQTSTFTSSTHTRIHRNTHASPPLPHLLPPVGQSGHAAADEHPQTSQKHAKIRMKVTTLALVSKDTHLHTHWLCEFTFRTGKSALFRVLRTTNFINLLLLKLLDSYVSTDLIIGHKYW